MTDQFINFVIPQQVALKEMSLEERMTRINDEIQRQINPPSTNIFGLGAPSSNFVATYWVFKTYPDYAIVCKEGKYYRVGYTWEGDKVNVGEPQPVELTWMPKEVTEASYMETQAESIKGGKGSGNFGHAGRPGHKGGSAGGGPARSGSLSANERRAKVDEQVKTLAKKPLRQLRSLQDQKDKAIRAAYEAKDTPLLKRLQNERQMIDSAIDWQQYGSKVKPSADRPGSIAGIRSPKKAVDQSKPYRPGEVSGARSRMGTRALDEASIQDLTERLSASKIRQHIARAKRDIQFSKEHGEEAKARGLASGLPLLEEALRRKTAKSGSKGQPKKPRADEEKFDPNSLSSEAVSGLSQAGLLDWVTGGASQER